MNNIKNSRAKPNSSANFAGIDINYLVAKVRNGSATREEFQMLASFCGTYLQKWQGYGDTSGQWYNPETGMWEGNYGRNAGGTDNWRGGLTWVGESGPELVNLPRGSEILSAQDSALLTGGDTFNFNIDVKDLEDLQTLILWAKNVRVTARMG